MTFLFQQAVLWPVIVPIITAALCACFWVRPDRQRWISLAGIIVMLAASILLLHTFLTDGTPAMAFGNWRVPFGIGFVADGLSAAMVLITAVLALAVAIYGFADLRKRQEHGGYHLLLQGLLASVNGAFLTGDIFNLYVWFEIMLVTAMGLLVIDRTRAQLDGAVKYAVLNLFATIMLLLAITVLYGITGTLNLADLRVVMDGVQPSAALYFSVGLFFVAFAIKAGFFPFFFWLPASYHTASIPVLAIFAGLITKVGVYACFRVFTLLFDIDAGGLRVLVGFLAAGTMLFGVFGAAVQWDVRRILSFHIVSQIGYMMLGLALATPLAMAGAVFYIIHHIIVKANLFLLAGAIYRATGTYDLRKAGGLMTSHPLLAFLFLVPAMSLAGIPPLSGFWAKFLVIDASFRDGAMWLAGVSLFVGLMTLFSMSKIWMEAFLRAPAVERSAPRRVPAAMLAPIALLGLITLVIGFYPDPFITYAAAVAESLDDPTAYVEAVLGRGVSTAGVAP